MWVYFWALYSVPLVCVSVLMPVPSCFNYSGLVIQFDIRYCDPSYFVLLSQNCYDYSGFFMVPYKFLKQVLERMWRKGNPSALLVGMQTGEATVENSMEFPQKTKNGTAF